MPPKNLLENQAWLFEPSHWAEKILSWYEIYGRKNLPWQQNPSPYKTWISEIMLQQTQVTKVIPYFERWLQSFPQVYHLANAQEDAVLHLWQGLGYYARARNLRKAAQIIVHDYGGEIPSNYEALIGLPGIGKTTAHAILAQAFGLPYAILDGNVKRVLARVFLEKRSLNSTGALQHLWYRAKVLLPPQNLAAYSQAMMDLGALVCTRHKPLCGQCPVQGLCQAYQSGEIHRFPVANKRPPKKKRALFVAWFMGEQGLLVEKQHKGIWQGLWSPPYFSNLEALAENFHLTPKDVYTAKEKVHYLTHQKLHLIQVKFNKFPQKTPGDSWYTAESIKAIPQPFMDWLKEP